MAIRSRRVIAGAAIVIGIFGLFAGVSLLAVTSAHERIASLAVKLPWPEFLLRTIVRTGRADSVRHEALMKLTNSSSFFELAMDDAVPLQIRLSAVSLLERDDSALHEIAIKASEPQLSVAAVDRISDGANVDDVVAAIADHKKLAALARGVASVKTRLRFVARVTDQEELLQIALHDTDDAIIQTAQRGITRYDLILTLLRARVDSPSKEYLSCLVEAPDALAKAATSDSDPRVRAIAASCLWDTRALDRILAGDPSQPVRRAAAYQLVKVEGRENEKMLQKIAATDPFPEVRDAAREYLRFLVYNRTPSPEPSYSSGSLPTYLWHDPPRNHESPGVTLSVPGQR